MLVSPASHKLASPANPSDQTVFTLPYLDLPTTTTVTSRHFHVPLFQTAPYLLDDQIRHKVTSLSKSISRSAPSCTCQKSDTNQRVMPTARKPQSLDFLLQGDSIKTNPYLIEFSRSKLLSKMLADPNFEHWTKKRGLKKEITEASAALQVIRKCLDLDGDPTQLSPNQPTSGSTSGSDLTFIELCSGGGFLSVMLCDIFPHAHVHMIDKNKHINLRHLNSMPRARFYCTDLHAHETQTLISDIVIEDAAAGRRVILVGVHLCGALAHHAIQLWEHAKYSHALILSPCCLPRRHRADIWGYHVNDTAKKLGIHPYKCWCDTLFDALPKENTIRHVITDKLMLSDKNVFLTVLRSTTKDVDQ